MGNGPSRNVSIFATSAANEKIMLHSARAQRHTAKIMPVHTIVEMSREEGKPKSLVVFGHDGAWQSTRFVKESAHDISRAYASAGLERPKTVSLEAMRETIADTGLGVRSTQYRTLGR